MELEKLGSIEITSGQITISDPIYREIIDVFDIDNVMNGTYNCYCTRDWTEFGNKISSIKLIHESYSLEDYCNWFLMSNILTTNSVIFCIMDSNYYGEVITKEKADREQWLYEVMTKINQYLIIDNRCIASQANFGNLTYDLKVFENDDHKKIGLEIPYLK